MTSNKYAVLKFILHTATLVHVLYWKLAVTHVIVLFFFLKKPIWVPPNGLLFNQGHKQYTWASKQCETDRTPGGNT